jgi:hypothetical protein
MPNTLAAWHELIQEKNTQNISVMLADTVVMHSPVMYSPVVGKALVSLYLTAAFYTFINDDFKYVRELASDSDAILEFTTVIDGIFVNGVDMMTWNEAGEIVDFKVMVRPLKAVNLIHEKMQILLEKLK